MSIRFRPAPVALIAIAFLLTASDAFAWGPITHTKLATDLLSQIGLLPAAVAYALRRHGTSYVFGNIAADVVLAKRLSRVKQFCHHWTTGFDLLSGARQARDQAFAYGYLSHLAADTVAHSRFIPHQLLVSRTTLNFGHVYWEMRADAALDHAHWRAFRQVMAADHEHHHRILGCRMVHAVLPYRYNRRVFDRINQTLARPYWRTGVSRWARHSRWSLCDQTLAAYHGEAVERIISVLTDLHGSPVLREDPNGNAMLRQIKHLRRQNRRLSRRGVHVELRRFEAAASIAPDASPATTLQAS